MLKIGAKVYLRRIKDKRQHWYNCRVDDQEKSKLIITLPMEGGNYLRLKKDEEVEIGFIYREELYCVLARVEGLLKGETLGFFITTPAQKEVYLKKRRDAERLDVLLSVKGNVRPLDVSITRGIKNPIVLNLSRSGMLLSADEPLAAGDELSLAMELNGETVNMRGHVLGRVRGPSRERARYHMRVMFSSLDDNSRKRLVSFIRQTAARRG